MTKSKEKALQATRVVLEQLIKFDYDISEISSRKPDPKIQARIEDLACELDALIKVYVK
jgi:phosphoribosylaminoimidazole carboxylase (NCAIR synthetase)